MTTAPECQAPLALAPLLEVLERLGPQLQRAGAAARVAGACAGLAGRRPCSSGCGAAQSQVLQLRQRRALPGGRRALIRPCGRRGACRIS